MKDKPRTIILCKKKDGKVVDRKEKEEAPLYLLSYPNASALRLFFCFGAIFVIPACSLCYALKLVAYAVVRITFFFFFSRTRFPPLLWCNTDIGVHWGVPKTTQALVTPHFPPVLFHLYLFYFYVLFRWSSGREYWC